MSKHLNHELQARLALRAQAGDREARERLLETNQALVAHWARRYQGRGVELDDLMQEGQVGMMKAIDRFQAEKGARFATYATLWIRQALGRACESQGSLERFGMRLPSEVCSAFTKIDDPAADSFAVEQARRMHEQGRPQHLDAESSEILRLTGAPDPSPALIRMLLAQSCGHLDASFQTDILALHGTELAARAWAGSLSDEAWWLLGRDPAMPWKLELLLGQEWFSLSAGAGRLSDEATDRLLCLCDDLCLAPADSCPHCA